MNNRREYRHSYYIAHRDTELRQQKSYRKKNADKIKSYEKSPTRKFYQKQYREHYQREYQREYVRRRRKEDVDFYLRYILRCRMSKALTRNQKTGSAIKDLGCTIPEFKVYIESKFQSGMTWNNHGKSWHIDHIIPLAKFNLQDRHQFLIAAHYTNLQPLWAKDNIIKGDLSILDFRKGEF